ncbi:hypothetical protein LTR05_003682 [Lithohypha guttulata]|uniref:Shugoshin n=1 Tax=Lithohypha guttulata TaxID=1690604 RepID=A0AAN7T1M4_9EURO|nr:hypothetical protein LTR05_003682 [Lithohypha guttulata]
MARLNEVPAPAAETIESIKRRFIRQNREIARVNSNQSIRIRNLENELARLIAENVKIREEAISAKVEAEKWKAAHRLSKEVLRMKSQLEEKLSEVNALVGELGGLPEKVARRSSQRRRRDCLVSELVKTDEEPERRQRQTLCDQEGRLPAILEDKYYPRRTLEAKEIRLGQDDEPLESLESPDLGPPPVAHFDEHEALTFNATKSPRRTSTELIEESEQANRVPNTNLENKRRRRISTLLHSSALGDPIKPRPDMNDEDTEEAQTHAPAPDPDTNGLNRRIEPAAPPFKLRTGAKRKLEMSELEDTSRVSQELDDFIFQRKAIAPTTVGRPSRFTRPAARQGQDTVESVEQRSPERLLQSERRILAPKSTNSPAKRRIETLDKPVDNKEVVTERRPERRMVSRTRSRPVIAEVHLPVEPTTGFALEKSTADEPDDQAHVTTKTPAAELDAILSPSTCEPSVDRRPPQEMAITNSVEDVLSGSIGRGSRRARAPISYAPPKLNTKLRRPGKELVDAVEGLTRIVDQKETFGQSNNAEPELQSTEPEGGPSEHVSPLKDKEGPVERRSSFRGEELSKAVSRLSMYDPPISSPLSGLDTIEVTARRRQFERPDLKPDSDKEVPGLETLKSRRPNSALGSRQSVQQAQPDPTELRRHARSASNSSLSAARVSSASRVASGMQRTSSSQEDVATRRSHSSALTRRKSMMV